MISESRLDLRPLDLAAVLDASVEIYRRDFLMLAGISAVVYVPFGLLSLAGSLVNETVHALVNLLGSLLLLPVWPLVMGALIQAVAQRYRGQPATLVSSYRAAFQRALPLIVTAYMVGIAVAFGMLALVVGAVVVSVVTTFALHAVMLEDRYYDQSFTRSFELTREQWPRVLALGVVLWLLQMVLSLVPVALAGFLVGDTMALNAFSSAWTAVSNPVLVPVSVVPFVVLYFDIRVRQEALDLRLLADRLGPLPPPRQVRAPQAGGGACPRCQWPIPAGAAFCIGCGAAQQGAS